ncbi:unnamed protein product [Staurois parvus]|uniref:Uncharacterized protein n=1 Tax=Staurois parvus TaxID=386267 RepID=A0ABN9HE59_9NEOB|nr:unnamed protein product [Staurois parvus]
MSALYTEAEFRIYTTFRVHEFHYIQSAEFRITLQVQSSGMHYITEGRVQDYTTFRST